MLSIENVNLLDYSDFKDKFGSVIEHCPFVAAGVWSSHPFLNRESLHSAFGTFLDPRSSQQNHEARSSEMLS